MHARVMHGVDVMSREKTDEVVTSGDPGSAGSG